MRFMAILDHRLLRASQKPAGNFEKLLALLLRDSSSLAASRPACSDAYCAAAQDPLLLAEWLRAVDEKGSAQIPGSLSARARGGKP